MSISRGPFAVTYFEADGEGLLYKKKLVPARLGLPRLLESLSRKSSGNTDKCAGESPCSVTAHQMSFGLPSFDDDSDSSSPRKRKFSRLRKGPPGGDGTPSTIPHSGRGGALDICSSKQRQCQTCCLIIPAHLQECKLCDKKLEAPPVLPKSEPPPPDSTAIKEWTCEACTFINSSTVTACEMCEGQKPQIVSQLQRSPSLVQPRPETAFFSVVPEAARRTATPSQQPPMISRRESDVLSAADVRPTRAAAAEVVMEDRRLSADKHFEPPYTIESEDSDVDEVISLSDGGSDEDFENVEEDDIEEVSGCEECGNIDLMPGAMSSFSRFSDRYADTTIRSTYHSEPCLAHIVSVRELQMNQGACSIDFNAFLMNQKGPARDLKYEKRKESRLGKTNKSKKKPSGAKFHKKRRTS